MFSYKKSAFAAALLLLFSVISPACAESQASLKSPDGWRSGELRSVTLDTVSGNQGYWLERDYRTAKGVSFKATLIGGKGVAARFTPRQGDSSDGVLGSGGVYKTFMIGEFQALSDRRPSIGLSLSVKIGDAVLTLESPCDDLSDDELIAAAIALISDI